MIRLLLALASSAEACSVCFGKAKGPAASGIVDGIWWGIVLLLASTFSLLGGIGWLLWRVEKTRAAEESRA